MDLRIFSPKSSFFLSAIIFSGGCVSESPPELIDWTVIELAYGSLLDEVEALARVRGSTLWESEVEKLSDSITKDETIATLVTFSDNFLEYQDSKQLVLGEERLEGSCNSLTGRFWNENQMMVCKRRGEVVGRIKTLLYRRITRIDDVSTYIDVEFYYQNLVEKFHPVVVDRLMSGSDAMAEEYDDLLLGNWSIEERLTRTVDEERRQTGLLTVGPRLYFGTYAVKAEIQMNSSLRHDQGTFLISTCQQDHSTCQYAIDVNGELSVVNSKVRIVFDDAKIGTDVLTLDSGSLIGRNNNFGTTVRLKRQN